MKTLTLRISETDYQLLHAVATSERMSMAAYLLRLFDKHGVPPEFKKTASVSHSAKPKTQAEIEADLLADVEFDEE
jgi:hypothetical protein